MNKVLSHVHSNPTRWHFYISQGSELRLRDIIPPQRLIMTPVLLPFQCFSLNKPIFLLKYISFTKDFIYHGHKWKTSLSLWYSVCYREIRDVIKTHCNYEDFLLALIRRNGKGHLLLTTWLCFLICICVPYRIIRIQQVTRAPHLGWKCIVEVHVISNKVNNPWYTSTDSGALLWPKNTKYILSSLPQIHFWPGLFFPCTLYSKLHFSLCFHL